MKLKRKWLRCYNVLLAGLLTLLGYSCEGNTEEPLVEYGQPHARYEIKGKVENAKKEKVSGVQVIIKELFPGENDSDYADTLKTNAYGEFHYQNGSAWPRSKFRIIWNKDEKATAYKTDSIDVDMGKLEGGNGSWYEGEASKEITITLTEKTQEANAK